MMNQNITLCHDLPTELAQTLRHLHPDRIFLLTDVHTHPCCRPLLGDLPEQMDVHDITVDSGDESKTLDTLAQIWTALSNQKATRHSLLINLGGGMITDMGGFAAACFKRGIRFINIPTTLLAMVDASVGGKTGINFNGFKNEIGAFAPSVQVLLDTQFLKTLDRNNLLSGYGEMLKHGLISTPSHWAELLNFDTDAINYDHLKELVGQSVDIKEKIVKQDPYEKNIRKALNFGQIV